MLFIIYCLLIILVFVLLIFFIKCIYKYNTKKSKKPKKIKKIVLCFFGIIPRSIKYTYKSIKENIIDKLANYELDIYVFNLNVGNKKIDNTIINQKDVSIIPYTIYEEYDQDLLDKQIRILKSNIKIKFRGDYNELTIQNALRQMYSEYRVGLFLERNINKYDIAIVCGPDYYIANPINIDDIKNSFENENFYTTTVNDAQGYTNGFYIGKPNVLIKPLKRFNYLHEYLPTDKDYESLLKESIIDNNIERNITKLVFFKIRANKSIEWQGGKKVNYLNDKDKKIVLDSYDKLLTNGF